MERNDITMSKKKKIKYNSMYIAYVAAGESAAVFIIRDVCRSIDTTGFWIDITNKSACKNGNGIWNFDFIDCELFPRITKPDYSCCNTDDERRYVTWMTAHNDISFHKKQGYKGRKYRVVPLLLLYNKSTNPDKPDCQYTIKSVNKL